LKKRGLKAGLTVFDYFHPERREKLRQKKRGVFPLHNRPIRAGERKRKKWERTNPISLTNALSRHKKKKEKASRRSLIILLRRGGGGLKKEERWTALIFYIYPTLLFKAGKRRKKRKRGRGRRNYIRLYL